MNNLEEFLTGAFDKVKGMVDVNSIVGKPIVTADGTTLIPVTKVSVGMGVAGVDSNEKTNGKLSFSGGTGAGVTINPVAFIVISGGNARVVYVNQGERVSTVDRILDMVPPTVDKIVNFIDSRKQPDKKTEESSDEPDFEVEYYVEDIEKEDAGAKSDNK